MSNVPFLREQTDRQQEHPRPIKNQVRASHGTKAGSHRARPQPQNKKKIAVFLETIKYLRDLAQTCTRLARACPHSPTAHGLEEIAIDLMAKARELEQLELD